MNCCLADTWILFLQKYIDQMQSRPTDHRKQITNGKPLFSPFFSLTAIYCLLFLQGIEWKPSFVGCERENRNLYLIDVHNSYLASETVYWSYLNVSARINSCVYIVIIWDCSILSVSCVECRVLIKLVIPCSGFVLFTLPCQHAVTPV